MSSSRWSTPIAVNAGPPVLDSMTSCHGGPVQLTVPSDAGTFAMSFRTSAGTDVSATRHEPLFASLVAERHVVTPYSQISVPAVTASFHVIVVMHSPPEGMPSGTGP